MPVKIQQKLQKPDNFKEFEDMVQVYLSTKYQKDFHRYGRQGQKQNGIDVFCSDGIVAQCKNYQASKLTTAIIDSDIEKAKQSFSSIEKFIVATAEETDSKLQLYILNKKPGFELDILFWEDIEKFMLLHPEIMKLFNWETIDPTEEFISKVLDICHQYCLYDVLYNNDFMSAYHEKDYYALEYCNIDLYPIIYSQNNRNIKPEVVSDFHTLLDLLQKLTNYLSLTSFTSGTGNALPQYQYSDEKKRRDYLLDLRTKICDIYRKYQFPF